MTTTPTTIEAQRGLQQLYDRTEITDLVYRLGSCLDEGRYDEMRELLVEDATVSTPGGRAEGREALIAQARRNHPADQRFQHVTTNVLLELDGDRAKVRANLIVTITTPDAGPSDTPAPPPRCTIGEVYSFELVRTRGGWRFSRIETVPLWVSGTVPTPARAA
jgi:SnoaL-like protein